MLGPLLSLRPLLTFQRRAPRQAAREALPVPAQVFTREQLERHAHDLAQLHGSVRPGGGNWLIARLGANAALIGEAYEVLAEAMAASKRTPPAAQWLVDNMSLVRNQVAAARRHLPRAYNRRLPRLARGSQAGLPRVYAIILDYISHADGRVESEALGGFINAYQEIEPLTLGELWAVPIMLRLALIENLAHVAARVREVHDQALAAAGWADRLIATAEHLPAELVIKLAELAREIGDLPGAFVAELVRRIQGQHTALAVVVGWMESRLAEHHATIESTVLAETQAQAGEQLTAGITIGSLRALDEADWREFVEQCSHTERALRDDPDGTYPLMDERTRDHYRHAVEDIARAVGCDERDAARRAVELATAAAAGGDPRHCHVGWWLIGDGRDKLQSALGTRSRLLRSLGVWRRRHPLLPFVLGVLLIATAGACLATAPLIPVLGIGWWLAPLLAAALVATSQPAVSLMSWLWARALPTTALPRLDLSAGIGAERRTLVVVPTMLRRRGEVAALCEGLELRYLANPDPDLRFALLTDLVDAPCEVMPDDQELVDAAAEGIAALNTRHAVDGQGPFLLLHRPRRHNPAEGCWMGRERKRGKLEDLNRIILHGDVGAFARIVGDAAGLDEVRYVITLDTDTMLPPGAARTLVGSIAHPLNRPEHDPLSGMVTDGHALLQPRVAISTVSAGRSRFSRMRAPEPGIDSYSGVSADLWQDLCGEGSFVGKGIYDVAAFARALDGRFPDNAVLSHDLIEGCYARSALISDVSLVEDQPASLLADAARRHRWMRGDWQISPWLLPWVRDARGRWRRNTLPPLARWKIADNLRRALVAPALLALVVVDLTIGSAGLAVAALVALWLLTPVVGSLLTLVRPVTDTRWHAHLRVWADGVAGQLAGIALWFVMLPCEAWLALHAAVLALWRMLVSRRRMLEWQTSAEAERLARTDLPGVHRALWSGPVAALGLEAALVASAPALLWPGCLLAACWAAAPAVAWWLSRPLPPRERPLPEADRAMLGSAARATWRYFECFISAEDHFLPPDNVQEHPVPATAHRTSPTNIGFALLSDLAAHDLGYLATPELLERVGATLTSVERLERHHGHLYNWYDTRSLAPLPPRYVSTVDSGNLAASLAVLAQGLIELTTRAPDPRVAVEGLRHAAANLRAAGEAGVPHPLADELDRRLAACPTPVPPRGWFEGLASWAEDAALAAKGAGIEVDWWLAAVARQARGHARSLAALTGWSTWREVIAPVPAMTSALGAALATLEEDPSPVTLAAEAPAAAALARQAAMALVGDAPAADALGRLASALDTAAAAALACCESAHQLAERANTLADGMDFRCLFDRRRRLFSIGMQVDGGRMDRNCYDLLASEARLSSFWAVARGQAPLAHWFALGRPLTASQGQPALVSWSGSMFEYLMPDLLMPVYPDSLLERSNRAVVARQIAYGEERGVPWGISESGYHLTDAFQQWQYRGFGVPGLGLKRGLGQELVIAPYATALALLVDPPAACANLRRLADDGYRGRYGWYEAIDFTPARLVPGTTKGVVRSWMVHHQGMSLLAMLQALQGGAMRRRFLADPGLRAVALLLQERAPLIAPDVALPDEDESRPVAVQDQGAAPRVVSNPNSPQIETMLLSNGRYHVLLTAAGGGASRWKEHAVNRWREDAVRESDGLFCYLHDVQRGVTWSNTYQPTLKPSRAYEAIFSHARAEFRRRDHDLEATTEIAVSPEDDIELRRITLINRSSSRRIIELTSCAEMVAGSAAADAAHPAFSALFVRTEIDHQRQAVLCQRRPRRLGEAMPVVMHLMTVHGEAVGGPSYETDRLRFIGRERNLAAPAALDNAGPLSGTCGAVLDPLAAIRRRVEIEPGGSVVVDLVWGMFEDDAAARVCAERYRDRHLTDRVFGLAWSRGRLLLHQLNLSEAQAQSAARLAGALTVPTAHRRAPAGVVALNRRAQPALWPHGISGDLPIVLLRINDPARLDLVREVLAVHAWWRAMGLMVDLVLWNEDASGYRQPLHDQLMGMVAAGAAASLVDKPGGVFVRRADLIPPEDRILLQAAARLVIDDAVGSLEALVERRPRPDRPLERLEPQRSIRPERAQQVEIPDGLRFANGFGGFTPAGDEYVTVLEPGLPTPAPWVNVLANQRCGAVVSTSGAGYTWAENCHEFRLTPWYGDAVTDQSGESLYLRDEESGQSWSPCPWPARAPTRYVVRHGFGYSTFSTVHDGLASELTTFVANEAPVRYLVWRIANRSQRMRRLSLTACCEMALGELRSRGAMHVISEVDRVGGALTARNPFNTDFGTRVVFLDASVRARSVTADRCEFLGRNGTWQAPDAQLRTRLGGRTGPCLDPCLAMRVPCELAPGQEREVVFVLGCGNDAAEAREVAQHARDPIAAKTELAAVRARWRELLGTVRFESGDESSDLLTNGWLMYQVLASRVLARSGFFQSGGAYGFRDQLQDAMALVHTRPDLLREQILRAAGRQFAEGDVQHWWHPPAGRGVRTHCSDDLLWLPLAASRYVEATGDEQILDEVVPFLSGRAPKPGDGDIYELPHQAGSGTLYEHCLRAVRRAGGRGRHELPLIGTGDWNDGFDRLGHHGRGESVWLGFFLHEVSLRMARLAERRDDQVRAGEMRREAGALAAALDANAWDGEWYVRAFTDDGQAVGRADASECRIDSLPQTWAVLSGATDPQRARTAMEAVDGMLVRRDRGLVQLFDPPFDQGTLDPGYIRGYPPGVRENGGQYTHAAVWVAMAFARLGDAKRAWEVARILDPIRRGGDAERLAVSRSEPYVLAADVYGAAPHIGRSGWTWYTGSAGWLYRLLVEELHGLRLEHGQLQVEPVLAPESVGFRCTYRRGRSAWRITVARGTRASRLDGVDLPGHAIPLVDDGREHAVDLLR